MSDLLYIKKIPVERLRDQVIEQLQENYARDVIEMEEYERRLELATASEDRFELLKLVQDLPIHRGDSAAAAAQARETEEYGDRRPDRIREQEHMVAVFSGVSRKGRWRPARSSKLLALFGGLELDFRKAELPPGDSYIDGLCLFGGGEITVPEGINVEVESIPIFGGVENRASGEYFEGAPTIYIRALVIFGGLEIRQKGRRRD